MLGACLFFGLATGCFTTTVRSGQPPGREAAYERLHNGYLGGLIESSGPYDLPRLCPEGWSEVTTSLAPEQALTSLLTLFIYMPQTVTIVCAAPGATAAAPKAGFGGPETPYLAQPPAPQPLPPVSGPIPKPNTTRRPTANAEKSAP
jgi:hypothetical protein